VELANVPKWFQKYTVTEDVTWPSAAVGDTNPPVAQNSQGVNAGFNFHFVVTNEKLAHNTRKRYENQVRQQYSIGAIFI